MSNPTNENSPGRVSASFDDSTACPPPRPSPCGGDDCRCSCCIAAVCLDASEGTFTSGDGASCSQAECAQRFFLCPDPTSLGAGDSNTATILDVTPCVIPPPPPPSPSPPPPPPPPPLPPTSSSQPPPPAAVVRLVLVAAGSVGDFGLARRTELRIRLAAVAGVAVEKVTLSVEAASVRLRFSVSVEAAVSTALAALEAALPGADAASAVLGVAVLTTPLLTLGEQPPRLHRDPILLHRDPTAPFLNESASHVESGGGEDSSLALPLAGAGALLLAGLLLVVAAVLFRRAKRGRTGAARELPSTFVTIQNIAQQPAIIVAGSPVVHETGWGNPYDRGLVTPSTHARPSTSGGHDSPPHYEKDL